MNGILYEKIVRNNIATVKLKSSVLKIFVSLNLKIVPSNRIRTSDLWISALFNQLQSTALPTELSKESCVQRLFLPYLKPQFQDLIRKR